MRRRRESQKNLRDSGGFCSDLDDRPAILQCQPCTGLQSTHELTLRPLTMWYQTDEPPKSTWKSV